MPNKKQTSKSTASKASKMQKDNRYNTTSKSASGRLSQMKSTKNK